MPTFAIVLTLASCMIIIGINVADNGNKSGATIIAKVCDTNKDAEALDQLISSHDDKTYEQIIDLLTDRTNDQRQAIRSAYDAKHQDKVLMNAIYNKFSKLHEHDDNIAKNMKEILRTRVEFLSRRIQHSLENWPDMGFASIICTSTHEDIKGITDFYPTIDGKQLTDQINAGVKDEELKKLILELVDVRHPRKDSTVDAAIFEKNFSASISKLERQPKPSCVDNAFLCEFLAKESFKQIKTVVESHPDSGITIRKYCKNFLGYAIRAITEFSVNSNKYFAEEIDRWIWDAQVDDKKTEANPNIDSGGTLDVIARSEIDLRTIVDAYNTYVGDEKLIPAFERILKGSDKNIYLMKKMIEGNYNR